MDITEISKEEYKNLVNGYLTVFEKPDFNDLNKAKCKEVLYLLFNDGKNRFGLIAGLKENGVLKIPFSASYSMFTDIRQNNRVIEYDLAVKSLIDFCKRKFIKEIYFTLPPEFYDETRVSTLENALFANNFTVDKIDLNFYYDLNDFDEKYVEKCDIAARKNIKKALSSYLSFKKAKNINEIKLAYEIIRQNRQNKGYPLHMSEDDVLKTISIIDADFFIVRNNRNEMLASAQIFHVTKDIVMVVYWGNISGSEPYRPMNYLAYKIFEHYKNSEFKYVDIGPSTENSIPNFGLCDFKQSIGCKTNSKYSFSLKLE